MLIKFVKQRVDLDTFGLLYYNSVISIPFVTLGCILNGGFPRFYNLYLFPLLPALPSFISIPHHEIGNNHAAFAVAAAGAEVVHTATQSAATVSALSPAFWIYFLLSCAFGFIINYSIFLNTSLNSPLTQNVVGQSKDCCLLLLSMAVFHDFQYQIPNLFGVLLSLFGAALYAFVKMKEQQKLRA